MQTMTEQLAATITPINKKVACNNLRQMTEIFKTNMADRQMKSIGFLPLKCNFVAFSRMPAPLHPLHSYPCSNPGIVPQISAHRNHPRAPFLNGTGSDSSEFPTTMAVRLYSPSYSSMWRELSTNQLTADITRAFAL